MARLLSRSALVLSAFVATALLARAAAHPIAQDALSPRQWCTVLASAGLCAGSLVALRGRTWGLLVVLATATSFAGAQAAGIAPPWFLAVAATGWIAAGAGALPALRFDRAAAIVLLLAATAVGLAAAAFAGPGLRLL